MSAKTGVVCRPRLGREEAPRSPSEAFANLMFAAWVCVPAAAEEAQAEAQAEAEDEMAAEAGLNPEQDAAAQKMRVPS